MITLFRASRFRTKQAGIAIGPILFVIAILGILAAALSTSMGGMGGASRADSITAQLPAQANLIRSKMYECNSIRSVWPTGTTTGNDISTIECSGDPTGLKNLWSGARPAMLPAVPTGFGNWTYYDYSGTGGGRCIRIAPSGSLASDAATKQGIAKAYSKFTTQEADYASGGSNQKFVIWITRPTGSAGANCVSD